MEEKPVTLILSLGKEPNKITPTIYGQQVAGQSSLLVVVAHSDQRYAN